MKNYHIGKRKSSTGIRDFINDGALKGFTLVDIKQTHNESHLIVMERDILSDDEPIYYAGKTYHADGTEVQNAN